MSILKTKEVSFTYPQAGSVHHATINKISFSIDSGETIGIIGHTGSGKSTLLQTLNGLIKPDSGTVFLHENDLWENVKELYQKRFKVGLVFQYPEYQLFEETAYKDIAYGPKNMGLSDEEIDSRIKVVYSRMKQQYQVDPVTFTAISKEPSCAFALCENYESGGAGLISTLEDYVKFTDAMACGETKDGYRILKPETVEIMKTNQLGPKSLETFRCATHNKGYGYGMGVRTMMDQNIEHSLSPDGEFGWDGAAGAYCLIDTENHLSIFYAQHVLGCSYAYSTVHKAIRNLVYKALEK